MAKARRASKPRASAKRGSRAKLNLSHRATRPVRRSGGVQRVGRAATIRFGGTAQFGVKGHGPSIKKPRMYEALRRKGYSKAKAARISNADANGTLDRGRRRRGPLAGPRA